ncbi:MAG: PIN domain nuclease [Micromonosporaceae bacterium]
MTPVRYLLDTSALVRVLRDPLARTRWEQQITAGLVAVCPIIELEMLYPARSKADREELLDLLQDAFTWVAMPDRVFGRATEIQAALTARGAHRSAGAVDLLVAAAAELHDLTLVHYDHDLDQLASVTGQPATWLAEPGAID